MGGRNFVWPTPIEAIESFTRKENKTPIDLTGLSVGELFTLAERPIFRKTPEALEQEFSDDQYRAKLALGPLSLLGTTAAFQALETFN